jgi:Lhr-like helicases
VSNAIIFTLDHKLVKLLPKFGYERLTEIQQKTIPKILLDNKDLLIISPTGSGKTEAVFFPLISLILKNPNKKIFAIYVTPLRSLNRDIFKRMKEICEELNIKVAVLHSDTTRSERREIYKDPPHILITTPETLDALSIFNFSYLIYAI